MFNSQFSILIRKEKPPHVCEPACKTNWSDSAIHWSDPGRIQGSGFCQVIFARALSMKSRREGFPRAACEGSILFLRCVPSSL